MTDTTIQAIFLAGFTLYEQSNALPAYIRKAAWCIMNCRTAVMGGHIQACPDGHFQRNHYNSCKHRMCPGCAYIQVQQWLLKQKSRLLSCSYFHVIFTIPHELNTLWKLNREIMINRKYSHGTGVITYLARYLRGGPISNGRIIGVSDGEVTFNTGRRRIKPKTLPIQEFIERFIQHIPKPRTMHVRSYGLFSSSISKDLALCRELLGQDPVEDQKAPSWQELLEENFKEGEDHPWECPVCGKRLTRIPGLIFPDDWKEEEQAAAAPPFKMAA
jgi:hypothetical protein